MTCMILRLRSRLGDDAGFAMLVVVVMTAVLSLLSVITIDLVTSEHGRSDVSRTRGTAFEAAEAGMNDYLAKLTDDKIYYLHRVHPAESTRHPASGADVDPQTTQCVEQPTASASRVETGVIWPTAAGTSWSYPNGKNNWCQLSNGYEYNLQITPPSAGNTNIQMVATGRKIGDTTTADWRAIEQWVHFSLVSEFQMITASNYSVGSTATTNGKVYAGIDNNGVAHNIQDHDGIATANLYAEGTISGSVDMQNGAQQYSSVTSPDVRSQIKQPIQFANFQMSLDDITRAADTSGKHLDSSGTVWRIVLLNNGNYTLQPCTAGCSDPAGATQPTWGGASTFTVPQNGAIFSDVTIVVSGQVNGRVTFASNDDVIVGGNISYVASGDDVLGLIAKNDVLVAKWGPDTLVWRAAVIAQNGKRSSYDSCGCKTMATHQGSSASYLHPFMDMFDTRVYDYDSTLLYLPPPWFPTVDDAYQVAMFREVKP
jgi:Tfp pilus assembly protein PilX